jgi:hypothetical protein
LPSWSRGSVGATTAGAFGVRGRTRSSPLVIAR